jgi:hypothetical protein
LSNSGRSIQTDGEAEKVRELIDDIIRRLIGEGWIRANLEQPVLLEAENSTQGIEDLPAGSVRFELTDKVMDYLRKKVETIH